jgi:hypothetical protein
MERDAKGLPERVTGVAHAAAAARAVMGPFSVGEGSAKAPVMAEARTAEKRPFMLTTGLSECFGGVDARNLGEKAEPLISTTATMTGDLASA